MPLFGSHSQAKFRGLGGGAEPQFVLAAGEGTLAGDSLAVTTGLGSIDGVILTLKGSAAPALETSTLTYAASGGELTVYAWEPAGVGDPTLEADTSAAVFSWIAIGQRPSTPA